MQITKARNFPYLTEVSVLAAILLTALNDHYFKYQFSGLLTGKISDFSGLYYVPFFIYALVSFVLAPLKPHVQIRRNYFLVCLVCVDITFILLKVTGLRIWFVDFFSQYFFKIHVVEDWTDLFAIIMNGPTYLLARKYFIN